MEVQVLFAIAPTPTISTLFHPRKAILLLALPLRGGKQQRALDAARRAGARGGVVVSALGRSERSAWRVR